MARKMIKKLPKAARKTTSRRPRTVRKADAAAPEASPKNPELARELGVLAKQLGGAIMSAAQSREAKDIRCEMSHSVRAVGDRLAKALKKASDGHNRREEVAGIGCEISRGARSIGSHMAKAMKSASQSPAVHSLKGQTKKVVCLSKDEGLKAAQKLRESVHAGMDAASQELKRLAEKIRKMK